MTYYLKVPHVEPLVYLLMLYSTSAEGLFKVVTENVFEKEKKSMTGPRQPRTCNHPINTQTLTGVCQAVRMFSPCQFHVYIYIYIYIYP